MTLEISEETKVRVLANARAQGLASSHRGIQAPGRRTDEDLRKHWGFGPRVEVAAEAPLHLEVSVRRPARTAAREFGNHRRRPQGQTTPRGDHEAEVGSSG